MRTARRLEASYRHGLRVRIGPTRARGVLLQCEKRDGSGKYWRVRLQGGEWVWPDASLLVDGHGDVVNTCASCELPFLMDAGSGELLCDRCHVEQFGGATRADLAPRRSNTRRRWRP